MRDEVLGFDEMAVEAEENLVIDVQFLIQRLLNESGMSRADLARRVGISRARLTQMMKPDANLQLRTIARVLYALGAFATIQRCAPASEAEAPAVAGWTTEEPDNQRVETASVGYDSVLAFKSLYHNQAKFLEVRSPERFDVTGPANDCADEEPLGVAA